MRQWNIISAPQVVLGTFLLSVNLAFLLYVGNSNQISVNSKCKSLQFDIFSFVYQYACDSFTFVYYRKTRALVFVQMTFMLLFAIVLSASWII